MSGFMGSTPEGMARRKATEDYRAGKPKKPHDGWPRLVRLAYIEHYDKMVNNGAVKQGGSA